MARVTIDNTAKLDLNGKTLNVAAATVNGVRLAPGFYTTDSEQVAAVLLDSVGGGQLVVTGKGMKIIVR